MKPSKTVKRNKLPGTRAWAWMHKSGGKVILSEEIHRAKVNARFTKERIPPGDELIEVFVLTELELRKLMKGNQPATGNGKGAE